MKAVILTAILSSAIWAVSPASAQPAGAADKGTKPQTDRKFNRMRPSMARVLGLETRSAKEG